MLPELSTCGQSTGITCGQFRTLLDQRARMKISIQGQDYTTALDAARPLTIERKLNEPSICEFWLSLPNGTSLSAPSRDQYVAVTGDDGTQYFTGYIAVSPLQEFAGVGIEGPRYRTAIQALSDEVLLDHLLRRPSAGQALCVNDRTTCLVPGFRWVLSKSGCKPSSPRSLSPAT